MKAAIATGLSLLATASAGEELTVYAPDYFASEWGPGPAIEQAFEAATGHDLTYVTGDLLPRLLLEGARTEADVVIGLDTDIAERARATGLFAPHGVDTSALTLPVEWTDETFLPFNWSHLAFVYDTDRLAEPPASFADLIANDGPSLVVQDPRTSVSGLATALWIHEVFGAEAEDVWRGLRDDIVTVTSGWSEAYGMFTEGEADMVLSFTTSPAYHLIAEDDDTVKAAIFPEGHYVLVETAGLVADTDSPEAARAFMDFVLTPAFQEVIPTGNWSFPAAQAGDLPEGFETLDMPDRVIHLTSPEAEAARDAAVAAFEAGLR
ncbi:thiamine ABC transporter substrate-binding protein [Jannaschia sp. Os4]|uniref:thiamine ABC transporter substrate-binding protein n=1 Tax=Jannaschia sp. Os4 TaxID=2807617 RepID=UPI00193A9AB8|nr:thiamine ABC transporter substrate binding subunit [Jannaschia sp. Os4]MBM2575479.1 thiamine ABC transporter substrate-binding protein [Jannaschia sp. Os4]